ncbi:MAG TPA: hypothetical protein PKD99_14085 [Sphingopyxis sp.]|nr:hypothetical protein [Sphingopyxis sp.]HMP46226.1 hypothetical protein [Sphingopyxis sp.]HMQ18594.1 hypothetical protein [Sphingopyxis sp.]
MNLSPSDLPRIAGAASLSKPGFDIILAVSGARQAASPTAALLEARGARESRADAGAARRAMLCGTLAQGAAFGLRPARFFDLSDEGNIPSESLNSLFTRGFQPMLKPSPLDESASDTPPSDDEHME